jgi:alkylhydroperoxidase AhpD family core domain
MGGVGRPLWCMNSPRIAYWKAAPDAYRAMLALEKVTSGLGIEPSLYELVKLRASQINGCAFCVDMHARDARKRGETEERLTMLCVWQEATCFTPRERAALRWVEALTRLSTGPVSDEDFASVQAEFSESEIVNLTLAIVTINGWNRFSVGFGVPPGHRFE